jgi:uncharacterized protein (DUF58 family)
LRELTGSTLFDHVPVPPAGFIPGLLPVPQHLGVFILLTAVLAFIAGSLRNELALILAGTVFFAILAYSLAALTFLSFLHRKKALSLSIRMAAKTVETGKGGEFLFSQSGPGRGRFFRLPGILIRYELNLATRDDRHIRHVVDPDTLKQGESAFPVKKRGAYYGARDRFLLFDVLGLFRVTLPLPQDRRPRLLAIPVPAAEFFPLTIPAGGSEQRSEPRFPRTDNLIDHRPYIPGDDPRRINWKLYGHAGGLFVREGEPEPPPHTRLVILVDTQTDPALYRAEAGRRGVDLLCENALAAALEYTSRGIHVAAGHTGGGIREGSPPELAEALAYPAALPLPGTENLPRTPEDRGLLILALPRTAGNFAPRGAGDSTALDRFLSRRGNKETLELIFLYEGDEPEESAEACARRYRQRGGIYARHIRR